MKLLVLILLFTNILFANVGKIVSLKGEANITRENKVFQVKRDTFLKEKDILTTKNNSKVQILFKDETIISIGKNSIFKINDYLFESKDNVKAEFSMIKGVFRTITGKIGKIAPQNFKLKTKSASIGIRGTQIITDLSNGKERIFCTEGQIEVTQSLTNLKIIVNKGEFIDMEKNNGNLLQKNKTKIKDLKEVNDNLTLSENKAVDSVTKKEDIEELPSVNTDTQTNTTETLQSEEVVKAANDGENNDEVSNTITQKVEEQAVADAEAQRLADELAAEAEEQRLAEEQAAAEAEALIAAEEIKRIAQEKALLAEQAAATEAARIKEETAQAAQDTADDAVQAAEDAAAALLAQATAENQAALDAANAAATAAAVAAQILADEQAAALQAAADLTASLELLTPDSYYINNVSKASYIGNFNDTPFDSERQYLEVDDEDEKRAIPTNTSISMDIDFGKEDDQLTNGKVSVPGYTTLEFDGHFHDERLHLQSNNDTDGKGGDSYLYGSEGNILKGDIELENDDIKLRGDFITNKYTYNNLDELTQLDYFTDNTSSANYIGNFNSYTYNSNTQFKELALIKYTIPEATTISMNIDFGASSNQIRNGLITHELTNDLDFNGTISGNSFQLEGINSTTGTGSGNFYGTSANVMRGEVDMSDSLGVKTKGNFDATKQ